MRIEKTVYYIVTKDRPIEFHAGNGQMRDNFADAEAYQYMDEAEEELETFDEPEKFEIIKGTVGIEV